MGPKAPFLLSSGTSVPVWAGLIGGVPVYSCVTTMPVPGHGPHWSRPWSVDYFPAWPHPTLITVDLPVDHWAVSDPGYCHQTCSQPALSAGWICHYGWLCLFPTNQSGNLGSGWMPNASPGPAQLPPSWHLGQSPGWQGPCPTRPVTTPGTFSHREYPDSAVGWHWFGNTASHLWHGLTPE